MSTIASELVLSTAFLLAGISGRIWGTFVPSEAAASEDVAPRGVSILARDLQSIVFYDSKGTFVGVRRPDSGKPIEVCC